MPLNEYDIPLINFDNNPRGILIQWDKSNTPNVLNYIILRASSINGIYTPIDSVNYPVDEYIDTGGTPSSYYKIREVGEGNVILGESQPLNGDELLLKISLAYEIKDLLHNNIYDEEITFVKNRTQGKLSFYNINYFPRPEVRISGYSNSGANEPYTQLSETTPIYQTQSGGNNYANGLKYYMDYKGNIFFVDQNNNPISIDVADSILVSYSVRLWTNTEMNQALNLAMHHINLQPGTNKVYNLSQLAPYFDPVVITGAAYYLLRWLVTRLSHRELRMLLIDGNGKDSGFGLNDLKEIMNDKKEEFNKSLETVGKVRFPSTKYIVTPEFNMPGSRSRYFRMMWKGNG